MTTQKRAGRPKRQPNPGERVPLGLRVTPELKTRLDDAANQSGRSQSQEAELRLEQSFRQDEDFGGPEIANIARLVAAAFLRGGQRGARARKHPFRRNRSTLSARRAPCAGAGAPLTLRSLLVRPDGGNVGQAALRQALLHAVAATLRC